MTIKKDLMGFKKDLTAICKKLEKLITAVEKSETKVAEASKPKAVKAIPAKKASKAPTKKKTVTVSATDQILNVINRSKKGLDTFRTSTNFRFNSSFIFFTFIFSSAFAAL